MNDLRPPVPFFRSAARETLEIIGRRTELDAIANAIGDESRESYVFYITAEGGTGKTRLLRTVINNLQEGGPWANRKILSLRSPIDLYDPGLHTKEGLVQAIHSRLECSPEYFAGFVEARKKLEAIRRQSASLAPTAAKEAREDLVKQFLEDFGRLTIDFRVVLCLDTAELLLYESDKMQQALDASLLPGETKNPIEGLAVRRWLINELVPRMANTVLLLAGRPQRLRLPGDLLHAAQNRAGLTYVPQPLEAFSEDETIEYFAAVENACRLWNDVDTVRALDHISDDARRVVHRLTRGRPILLGLTIDYLVRSGRLLPELSQPLASIPTESSELAKIREQLESRIVQLIQQAGEPEDEVIRCLGWARKGLDALLLSKLMHISIENAQQMLDRLQPMSFVRLRPGDPRLFPHDEMHVLLRRHVLDRVAPSTYAGTHTVIRLYYDDKLEQVRASLEHLVDDSAPMPEAQPEIVSEAWQLRLDQRRLNLERLYYLLRAAPRDGFVDYYKLAEGAYLNRDDETDLQLRAELLAFWQEEGQVLGQANPEQVRGLAWKAIDADGAVRWIKRFIGHNDIDRALRLVQVLRGPWAELLPDELAQADLDAWEAVAISRVGDERLTDAIQLMQEAISRLEMLQSSDSSERQLRDLVLAHAYTRLGFIFRVEGSYTDAIQHYRQALPLWEQHGADADLANALNGLGFALARSGQPRVGLIAVERAIRVRRRLGEKLALAGSLTTLGEIQILNREPHLAFENCAVALQTFTEAQIKGDRSLELGMVNRALAEANRRMAGTRDYPIDKRNLLLSAALEYAKEAVSNLQQTKEYHRLTEAEIELGCVYRDLARLAILVPKRVHSAPQPMAEKSEQHLEEAAVRAVTLHRTHLAIDAKANLSWLHYYLKRQDAARATVLQALALISDEYRIDRGARELHARGQAANVQLGKLHNLLGQLAADGGNWKEAAREFALAVAYNLRFANEGRDFDRLVLQISERLDELSSANRQTFLADIQVVEREYSITVHHTFDALVQSLELRHAQVYGDAQVPGERRNGI